MEDAFLVGPGVLPSDGCDCTADSAERMAWRGRIGSRVGWPVGVPFGTLAEKAKCRRDPRKLSRGRHVAAVVYANGVVGFHLWRIIIIIRES